MARNRRRLTRQLLKELCDRLKAGAFEQVAAESLAVPYGVYRRWLERGQNDERGIYLEFFLAVQQARAHARLMAEMDLRAKDPKVWLLHGPGKETDGLPGWTAPARAADAAEEPASVLQLPEFHYFLNALLEALAPFAEARAAAAKVVDALPHFAPTAVLPQPSPDKTPSDQA